MWEAVHAKDDHDINEAVRFQEIAVFVFSDDLIRDVSNFHSDELRAFERGVEGDRHVSSWCGNVTGVIDSVPAYYKAGAIGFLLLRWDCAHKLAICDVLQSIVGDVFLAHKFDCWCL